MWRPSAPCVDRGIAAVGDLRRAVDDRRARPPADARAVVTFSGRARNGRADRYAVDARADPHGRLELPNRYPYAHFDPIAGWPSVLTITVTSGPATASTHARRRGVFASAFLTSDERPSKVGFYGEWIRRRSARHHTAILLFGGSEGGLSQGPLALTLAAHGYPVLDLAYFSEPGLPQSLSDIPLEYFERALRWLATQPAVDPGRIVSFGVSRGGEASLLIASTFPRLIHAAVGYVPSAYVVSSPTNASVPAWTYRGKPVPSGWIHVERINGPVFVVGGEADALWPSAASVTDIKARMLSHNRHDVTALVYPKAGHSVGFVLPRQVAVSPAGYGYLQSRYGELYLGGSPQADDAALEDSWPKLLRFLERLR